MVPLVLRPAGVGFGRVIVDDWGVTRRTVLGEHALAWNDIRDYRIAVEIRGARIEILYLVDWINAFLIAKDIRNGYRGDHALRFAIGLYGANGARVAFDWRFRGVASAIAQIYRHIGERLAADAQRRLAATGVARFGPLALAAHGIQWGDDAWLPAGAVESVGLFNSSPLALRVMARGKAWPYGQARTAKIPNIGAALAIAAQLGYPVIGRELFARLAI